MLDGFASTEPIVIHVEGLHRADAISVQVLRTLAQRLDQKRILLVGIYRADLPYTNGLNEWLSTRSVVLADFAPRWADDIAIFLDAMFGRKAPLNSMIEIAKNDERLLLLGGIPLLEACCRMGRWTEGLTLSERVITVGPDAWRRLHSGVGPARFAVRSWLAWVSGLKRRPNAIW